MSRVAIVTGGQQGIGLAIARELVGAGFTVAIVAELPDGAPAVATALAEMGSHRAGLSGSEQAAQGDLAELATDVRYYRHDLADIAAVQGLVARIEADLGPITALVSNAGVPARVRGDMLALTPDNFDVVLGINLRGTFFLAQEVARRMVARECGAYRSLVFVTSVSAAAASPERAEYCISKAGAAMAAQLFALRLAPHGIGVFDVRPGIIETAMTAGVREKYSALIEDGLVPERRWGLPEDVATAVLPLVFGSFRYSTGAVVPVDGGLTIERL